MARLNGSRQSAFNRAVLQRRVRRRQLAADLETGIVLHERRVGVLGAVICPECPWNSHVGNEPLHHSEDGRCALVPCLVWALKAGSAVHKHGDVPRASQEFRERSGGVDVDQVEWSLCLGRGAVRCRRAVSARECPWPSNTPSMVPALLQVEYRAVGQWLSTHSNGRGQGKRGSG